MKKRLFLASILMMGLVAHAEASSYLLLVHNDTSQPVQVNYLLGDEARVMTVRAGLTMGSTLSLAGYTIKEVTIGESRRVVDCNAGNDSYAGVDLYLMEFGNQISCFTQISLH